MFSERRDTILERMGVTRWQKRAQTKAISDKLVLGEENNHWERLEAQVKGCTQCSLHKHRTQTVFGTGPKDAKVLVIGEAPGAEEDLKGEPFVGKAGCLLDEMLVACDFPREKTFIANILKCRPPNNRNPEALEMASCIHFLRRQIELVEPKVILVLGRVAAQAILGTKESVGRLRGIVHYDNIVNVPVVVTYHPAYLLRSPKEKVKCWADLRLFKEILECNGK